MHGPRRTGATAAAHALPLRDGAEAVVLAGTAPDGAPWLQMVNVASGAITVAPASHVAGAPWTALGGAAAPIAGVAAGAAAADAPSAAEAGIRRANLASGLLHLQRCTS